MPALGILRNLRRHFHQVFFGNQLVFSWSLRDVDLVIPEELHLMVAFADLVQSWGLAISWNGNVLFDLPIHDVALFHFLSGVVPAGFFRLHIEPRVLTIGLQLIEIEARYFVSTTLLCCGTH